MEYINKTKIVIELFIYYSKDYEFSLKGLNGTFDYENNLIEFIKDFENDPPYMTDIIKHIEETYELEDESMFTVFTELDWESPEYGEYGYHQMSGYFYIGKILEVQKHSLKEAVNEQN